MFAPVAIALLRPKVTPLHVRLFLASQPWPFAGVARRPLGYKCCMRLGKDKRPEGVPSAFVAPCVLQVTNFVPLRLTLGIDQLLTRLATLAGFSTTPAFWLGSIFMTDADLGSTRQGFLPGLFRCLLPPFGVTPVRVLCLLTPARVQNRYRLSLWGMGYGDSIGQHLVGRDSIGQWSAGRPCFLPGSPIPELNRPDGLIAQRLSEILT